MSTTSVTGNDILIIDNRLLTDLADGDNGVLTHPNELSTTKIGKNGNALIAYNATGEMGELVIRAVRGSGDDRFLNQRMKMFESDPASFTLMRGTFIKRAGNGQGFTTNDTYVLQGGVPFKKVDATSNAEGNTDQAVAVHSIRFTSVRRGIM
jgi:hypothetical protein